MKLPRAANKALQSRIGRPVAALTLVTARNDSLRAAIHAAVARLKSRKRSIRANQRSISTAETPLDLARPALNKVTTRYVRLTSRFTRVHLHCTHRHRHCTFRHRWHRVVLVGREARSRAVHAKSRPRVPLEPHQHSWSFVHQPVDIHPHPRPRARNSERRSNHAVSRGGHATSAMLDAFSGSQHLSSTPHHGEVAKSHPLSAFVLVVHNSCPCATRHV